MSDELYKPRNMIAAIIRFDPVRTFFLDTFCKSPEEKHESDIIELDKYRSERSVSPFVSPLDEATRVKLSPYTTTTIVPPYIKEQGVITPKDLQTREIGSTIYDTPGAYGSRAEKKLGEILKELERRFQTTEEVMIAQALTTGVIVVKGPNVDAKITVGIPPSHKVTLAGQAAWSDHANCDIAANFRAWKRVIEEDSGYTPRVAVIGWKVADEIYASEKLAKLLDNRRIELGIIKPDQLPDGVDYLGMLENVDVYVYNSTYKDQAGVKQYFMPPHKVLLGATQARAIRHYGPIYNLKNKAVVKRFPDSWEKEDGSARIVQMETSPLPFPHEPESYLIAEVTAEP